MPNKFAFPGGGVDAADARVRSHTPYDPDTEVSLKKMSARKSPASLGLAAIRETFEETGLRIGVASANRAQSASHSWRCFFEASTVPSLSALTFVARAITPPGQRRRFDARFFMADISAIHGDPEDFSAASGELTHLQWARLSEVRDLDLPFITRFILDFIEPRLHEPEKHHPVPFTYERYGRDHLDHL
jgi:8-oxo-dGTP pyrophosphatase MutT (NUDIX family)